MCMNRFSEVSLDVDELVGFQWYTYCTVDTGQASISSWTTEACQPDKATTQRSDTNP